MTKAWVWYGSERLDLDLPSGLDVRVVVPDAPRALEDPLGAVAAALDGPFSDTTIEERARGASSVVIVVPDGTRVAPAELYLLPLIARLARVGLGPRNISVVVGRGIHPPATKPEVARILGPQVMDALRPVQSAPNAPESNLSLGEDPELGDVRVHRLVAEADLVVLTGSVAPHHLAGFGGGAKALVPGVADRDTVVRAHKLTVRSVVGPDGSLKSLTADDVTPNPFRSALVRAAAMHGRCQLLNVVVGDGGGIAAVAAGDVEPAHTEAIRLWKRGHGATEPEPADLVIVGTSEPRSRTLIQAHKALLVADRWARPGAPIVFLAPSHGGPGHADILPWFEIRDSARHLAALRQSFHPYGLTAYSIRRMANDHPVLVVSELSRDLLRPMGMLPFASAAQAIEHARANYTVNSCVVLPAG